jgi:DNA polymerase III alpha subunit
MSHIALLTEYSFRQCFLPMRDVHKYVVNGCVGIADLNSTFGHIPLLKESKKHGFKPIYGVRLNVQPDEVDWRTCNMPWIFIAKNSDGLQEIYELTTKAFDNFRYIPRLLLSDVEELSANVVVIPTCDFGIWDQISHLATAVPVGAGFDMDHIPVGISRIYVDNNNYGQIEDKDVYELMAGVRPGEDRPIFKFDTRVSDQHILSPASRSVLYPHWSNDVTDTIAAECCVAIEKVPPLVFGGTRTIREECEKGIKRRNVNMTPEYTERLEYEIKLIQEKGFDDYFLVVSDMIMEAKKTMLVGPCRGSSAGSLVCYLMGITEIDPIPYDLIFERFIDINRFDMPDIDIDFPDDKRDDVIAYLMKKYGKDKVAHLSNINRYQSKGAMNDFGKGLFVPKGELEELKGSIIERSGGDARTSTIMDDFMTETGKQFLLRHPQMELCAKVEGHATHFGKHAAGIIVANKPVTHYGAVNTREGSLMMDKRDAEYIDLLKIDCLGLRTLSILEECCNLTGTNRDSLYTLPMDDPKVFQIFKQCRLNGIFQFEGASLAMLVREVDVSHFDDLVAITAAARPGAMRSGGTAIYRMSKNGEIQPKYYGDLHYEITKDTYGVMLYQEQMMRIAREIAGFDWMTISDMRKAASKSLGDDYFKKFEENFLNGCMASGLDYTTSAALWKDVSHAGSWIFNKSHAVAYSIISYWTAHFKAYHPLEFGVACLNHAPDDDAALRLLRDLVVTEKLKYVPIDPDLSQAKWSIHNGTMLGGLTNLEGVGDKMAQKILDSRKGKVKLTPSIYKKLMNPKTTFDILFPTDHHWGKLIRDPKSFNMEGIVTNLRDVSEKGEYIVLGMLKKRNLEDLNEYNKLLKRGGQEMEESKRWYLNFIIEDDTDSLMCHIDKHNFNKTIARQIADHGKIDHDWYLVRGSITGTWRGLTVTEVIDLREYFGGTLA